MPLGEICKRFWSAIQNLRRRALELDHARVNQRQRLSFGQVFRELQVGLFQRPAKTPRAVSILTDVLSFRLVQHMPDVRAREAVRLHQGDEVLDELLEENIVLPERVVRVDEQRVASHYLESRAAPLKRRVRCDGRRGSSV